MANHEVEYIYINQLLPESELQVCRDGNGRLLAFYEDADGLEGQIGQEIDEEQYIDAQPEIEDQFIAEEAPVEITSEDIPGEMEVLQSTDGVGGDMKFLMVNQQEVFVVKNNSPPQQKTFRLFRPRRRTTPQSVKKGPKLIQDFLLPHLDNETFGHRLVWVSREHGTFAMSWSHKNGADWRADDCVVFREWDILKERKIQETPHYWMEAKQRFRAALAKVSVSCKSDLEEHRSSKVFQIKWTRETRPQILDKIYTTSKYFEMPPRLSLAKPDHAHVTASGYALDQDYAQEEVISPDNASLENDVQIEVVTTEDFHEEQFVVDALPVKDDPPEEVVIEQNEAAHQAAAAVLSSRFFTDRHKRARKLTIRYEALKPVEKILRKARQCHSKIYTVCPICQYLTANYSVLLRHLMLHRVDIGYTCLHCPKAFRLPELFIDHLRVHHSTAPHICFLANIEETSRTRLRRAEFRLIHQNLKTCGVCAEHCRTQCDLEKHVVELHGKDQLREVRRCALNRSSSVRMRPRYLAIRRESRTGVCDNDNDQNSTVVYEGRTLGGGASHFNVGSLNSLDPCPGLSQI